MDRAENGSTLVESVFGLLFLMTLMLGAVQVVFTIYSRNVVQASAHEGARVAIERGATDRATASAVHATVAQAAAGLLSGLDVSVERTQVVGGELVTVTVAGLLRSAGPVPVKIPVTAIAHAVDIDEPR